MPAEPKSVVILNHTKNPMLIKGLDGKPARVHIGDSIEVTPDVAEQLKKISGVVDAAKYQKPSSEVEALRAKVLEQDKEIAALKEELAKAKKK